MAKLNQIIALLGGQKGRTESAKTTIHHRLQKDALREGINRSYNSNDEEGEVYEGEESKVRVFVDNEIEAFYAETKKLCDLGITLDVNNCEAKADVVVDGKALASNVPVTHLLFLEKQVNDIFTFVSKLPTLDSSEDWRESIQGGFESEIRKKTKTKKVPKVVVMYDATPEHPAQTQLLQEDIVEGIWDTKLFSGNIKTTRKEEMLRRVVEVQDALKTAREEANSMTVTDVTGSDDDLLGHIFK